MIRTERHDDVAVLILEHGKVNAIDIELFEGIEKALEELALTTPDAPRALVLTGNGRSFSAGLDLFRLLREDADYCRRLLARLNDSLAQLLELPVPVVAALDGHTIAGGCILAAACDRRLMVEGDAKIGVSELLVGVPFPTVALELLRDLLPPHRVRDLITTGRLLDPPEALAIGLVDDLVPAGELLERACAQAAAYARIPTATWTLTRRQLRRAFFESLGSAAATGIDAEVEALWHDPDIHQNIRAFLEATVGKG